MDQKIFNKMWNKAYWRFVGIYSAIAAGIAALFWGGLWLRTKIEETRDNKSDLDFE